MQHQQLTKLYDVIKPGERFRLHIEALGRGDMTEARRLMDTCPKMEYREHDFAYMGQLDVALIQTLVVLVDVLGDIRAVRASCDFRGVLEQAMERAGIATATGNAERDKDEGYSAEAQAAQNAVEESALAVYARIGTIGHCWRGFDGFCRQRWGMPGLTLVRAWLGAMADEIETFLPSLERVPQDPAETQRYQRLLEAGFRQRMGLADLPHA